MHHLREGIHWRGVGQRDPLVEYRVESQKLFEGLQEALRMETLRIIMRVHPTDIKAKNVDDEYETELTRLAETAVEQGVNEATSVTHVSDDDFGKIKKDKTTAEKNHTKNVARKKKKAQRQNRKKNRR